MKHRPIHHVLGDNRRKIIDFENSCCNWMSQTSERAAWKVAAHVRTPVEDLYNPVKWYVRKDTNEKPNSC